MRQTVPDSSSVLVTGGAGDIGRAICRRLSAADYVPVVADLGSQIDGVDFAAEGMSEIRTVSMDVTDRASVERAVSDVASESPALYGLVNCAGVLRDTFLGELVDAQMTQMFEVNLAGMARVTDAVAPLILDGGAIVNIGSLTGEFGRFIGASVYGATKAGVCAYTRYLAAELAHRNIRVNNVAPGVIRVSMSTSMARVSRGEAACADDAMLKRLGEPSEVAEVVEFMLSSRASFITAQTLLVDGGVISW